MLSPSREMSSRREPILDVVALAADGQNLQEDQRIHKGRDSLRVRQAWTCSGTDLPPLS